MRRLHIILLIAIITLGGYFRLFGRNWDDNHHLHPDERFLTMVATGISWPDTLSSYFDTHSSPMNPHNRGFPFYVYGTFPLFLVKGIGTLTGNDTYNTITLLGRTISALFDLGTLLMVFAIARFVARGLRPKHATETGLVAAFFYASMLLPIQLSHFFTVDPPLTFFLTTCVYGALRLISHPSKLLFTLMGISLGLATTSKVSALLFLPTLVSAITVAWLRSHSYRRITGGIILMTTSMVLTVISVQPYLFDGLSLNPRVLNNWQELARFDDPTAQFPPAIQWIGTPALLFPYLNMLMWGLGLPIGIIATGAVGYHVSCVILHALQKNTKKLKRNLPVILVLVWVATLFLYQGTRFGKPMRYIYPIYPSIAVLSALFISRIALRIRQQFQISNFTFQIIAVSVGLLVIGGPISYRSIYGRPHTRITASQWIYDHIPPGSAIANEHWDDPLPLAIGGMNHTRYTTLQLPLYDPDTTEKWQQIAPMLASTDYIVLSSNRLYGSIPAAPHRYPIASTYYARLFDESLGFVPVAQFTSRPTIPIPGVSHCIQTPWFTYGSVSKPIEACHEEGVAFVDDYIDETWTVYDHPKVIIFQKHHDVDYLKVLGIPQ